MEPTPEPVPESESSERLEDEEHMRYPDHGDPETLRERSGLQDRDSDEREPAGPSAA